MARYALRRVLVAALTIWVAATAAFIALRLAPGEALTAQLALSGATEAQIAARRAALSIDQPINAQYVAMLRDLLRGDLGLSLYTGRSVAEMIAEQVGATAALAGGAFGVAFGVGIALGLAAHSRSPALRTTARALIAALLAVPVYALGTALIYLFSVALRWLPSAGDDTLRGLILPWIALGLPLAGGIGQVTAGALGAVREADFIRTARAKGLPEQAVVRRHALRAALAPVITFSATQVGFLLGGAAVTEMLFVRRGLGTVLLTAVNERDYPVVQGVVIFAALVYSVVNTAGGWLAALVDVRVRA
jgi:peptide/nickel transport system permease protein